MSSRQRAERSGRRTGRAAPPSRWWSVLLTPVLLLLPFLLPTSAQAVSVDGGALTPGTAATATFAAAGDQVTYTIAVPANQTVTLTAATSTDPVQVSVSATAKAVKSIVPTAPLTPTNFSVRVCGLPGE